MRQLLVFDRFLARATHVFRDAMVLKGGLVLEHRTHLARATRDIDLRIEGAPETVLQRLQQAARLDLQDHLTFEVQTDGRLPTITTAKYEGRRYRAQAKLAGKPYGYPFGIDVALGDPMHGTPDTVTLNDTLDFIAVPPPTVQLYPVATHIAEKLHAYTMPRPTPNTRVKDLPDIALLATVVSPAASNSCPPSTGGALTLGDLRTALQKTFGHRATHPIPLELPAPNPAWKNAYEVMAHQDNLPWPTLAELTTALQTFLNPALDPRVNKPPTTPWNPTPWTWQS